MNIDFSKEVESLKTKRDELKLQTHLMKAEAKDEWEKAENKWHELQSKMKKIQGSAEDASKDVKEAGSLLVKEIRSAYDKVKASL